MPCQTGGDGGLAPDAATRNLVSRRNLIVAGFAAVVACIAAYGQFVLGYLAHRTWYDDGVYVGAATRLAHGVVPYRDFVLLHPPGVLVLLTPFALVGRVVGTAAANEAARLFVMAAAVAAVFLFARVVRVRPDLALAVGLAVFVLHPDVIVSDQAVYLEPLLIVACLLGTALVFDGEELAAAHARWWWGGAVFGFACGLKLWAAFPILAIVLIAAVMRRWADAARLALASAAVFSLVCVPFLLFAPSAFVRYVLVVQASRTDPASATLTSRVGNLLYLPSRLLYLDSSIAENRGIVAVAVLLALSVVAWSVVRTRRRPLTALEWYSFVCAGLVVAAFLLAGDYFAHYGAFAALFFGLVASGTIARLLSGDTTAKARENERRFAPVAITAGLLVAVALLVAYDVHIVRVTTPDQKLSASALARIADVVPSGSCVVTDNPSVLLMSGTLHGRPVGLSSGRRLVRHRAGARERSSGSRAADREAPADLAQLARTRRLPRAERAGSRAGGRESTAGISAFDGTQTRTSRWWIDSEWCRSTDASAPTRCRHRPSEENAHADRQRPAGESDRLARDEGGARKVPGVRQEEGLVISGHHRSGSRRHVPRRRAPGPRADAAGGVRELRLHPAVRRRADGSGLTNDAGRGARSEITVR